MLKSMNTFIMLVILCGGLQMSSGEKLKCQFQNVNHPVVGYLYSCFVTSLDNSFDNMIIDGYTGVHKTSKTDKDVKAIFIHGTNLKYIPHGLGSMFNLLGLAIQNSQLVEIRSKDFQGMQNLEYLSLGTNKLTSISSDAFFTLLKLKVIYLGYNQIKYIGSGAFDQLTKLKRVYFDGNICINEYYNGATAIIQMKEDLKVNCVEPISTSTTTTTTTTTTQNPLEVELEALKNELAEAKNEIKKIKFAYEELNAKLTKCEANQQKSMEFSLICDFKMINDGQYTCETRNLIINQKEMELSEVIGTHLKSKSNQDVTELIIVKSSMFYWSNDIFAKFPALQILKIKNAQLNEYKQGDFSSAFNLRFLVVNGNNIKHLGDDVFHGTEENLTEININSNQIEKISAETFRGLKQLKVLSLKENLITEIPLGTFKDIVMLEILILTGNKIKFLDGKMLEFNKRLMTLAVDQNELREVGEEILDHSVELLDVNLEGNDCIDERTTINDDDTDGRTVNDLIFVIRNCCKNSAKGLNVYNCGQSGSEN